VLAISRREAETDAMLFPSCLRAWLWMSLALFSLAVAPGARAEKFTLVVLPDTQIAVRAKPELTRSQMDWVVKHRAEKNIPIVLHVGDVVDWDTPELDQWVTASECFERLDAADIPYAIAVGNHDTAAVQPGGSAAPGDVRANLRVTESFNRFFPMRRFRAQGGRMEGGKSDNAYYTFRAGGLDWLVIVLELWARPGPVEWANRVVAGHPNHNVIVLTHSHLNSRGEIEGRNGGYGDQSPRHVFDHFIAKHANVRLVFSGHVGGSAWREDRGEKGNRIVQILQCYQNRDAGGGHLRLLEVDPEAGTMAASMYSPFYDKTLEDGSSFRVEGMEFVRPAR
jgi:hypothetical protein